MHSSLAGRGDDVGIGAGLGVLVIIALYMLPTVIAAVREVVNVGSVAAINVLLGWTLVGWAVALAMALRTNPPHAYPQYCQQQHPRGGYTGPNPAGGTSRP